MNKSIQVKCNSVLRDYFLKPSNRQFSNTHACVFSDSLVLDFCGQRGGPRSQGNPFPASCPCYRKRETKLYPVLAIISSDAVIASSEPPCIMSYDI